MSYVRSAGMAGTNRVSHLGRPRFGDAVEARMLAFAAPRRSFGSRAQALGRLGTTGSTYDYGTTAIPSAGIAAAAPSLISQSIATTGALVSKALTPTPTVIYNPTTGLYEATGGAQLPASATLTGSLSTVLSAALPWLLIGGGFLLIISFAERARGR